MDENVIHIIAKDCLRLEPQESIASIIDEILVYEKLQTFHFSSNYVPDEDEKLIEFDYLRKEWKAGRYVGELEFKKNNEVYKLTIKPRFGELFLFKMLEEIFNIKIIQSHKKEDSSQDWQNYIKRIVSFLWLHKLASCNKYGLPKNNITREYKGSTVKGKLNVRRTILPLYKSSEIVSERLEKKEFELVARLIWQARRVLLNGFDLNAFKVPDSAKDVLDHIYQLNSLDKHVSESEYRQIQLKSIYQNWKGIIDFSWDIIKSRPFHDKEQGKTKGFAFFIDMAEVWELYLKSILRKKLSFTGWSLQNERIWTYPNKYFKRELIPDIVFEKKDELLVWDAKYKKMTWSDRRDFDRSDFFQIHTYIGYFNQFKKVRCGGLLYPLSNNPADFNKTKSANLFEIGTGDTTFIADGINLEFCFLNGINQKDHSVEFQKEETQFLERITSHF